MTTTSNHQPRKISLRALAAELDVNHASLSAAARAGRLVRGVRLERGRLTVTDADAAISNWREVHVPQMQEMVRRSRRDREEGDAAAEAALAHTVAAVLVVLAVVDADAGDRDAAIEKLRDRFFCESTGHLSDDGEGSDALRMFDLAAERARAHLAKSDEIEAVDEESDVDTAGAEG